MCSGPDVSAAPESAHAENKRGSAPRQRAQQATSAVLERLKVGEVREGEVASIQPYGAFVKLADGMQGLLHVSNVSHSRITDINSVVQQGAPIKVKVASVDVQSGRVALSRKDLEPVPNTNQSEARQQQRQSSQRNLKAALDGALLDFKEKDICKGTIKALKPKHAIVDLGHGVVGLLPSSRLSQEHCEDMTQILKLGDTVYARVLEISLADGLVLLATNRLESTPGEMLQTPSAVFQVAQQERDLLQGGPSALRAAIAAGDLGFEVGSLCEGTVACVTPDKAYLDLGRGIAGLLPVDAISKKTVTNARKYLQKGDRVKAIVVNIDQSAGFVELATKRLEVSPGDMLRNPSLVYQGAEKRFEDLAVKYRKRKELQAIRDEEKESFQASQAALQAAGNCGPKTGDVCEGTVWKVHSGGAIIQLENGILGTLNIRNYSHGFIYQDWNAVLQKGEVIKAMVLGVEKKDGVVQLSTAALEMVPGEMLRDRAQVFANADKAGECMNDSRAAFDRDFRRRMPEKVGQLCAGTVSGVGPGGASVDLGSKRLGMLPAARLSHEACSDVSTVLRVGDRIKAVIDEWVRCGYVKLSTKSLEALPGDFLKDPAALFDKWSADMLPSRDLQATNIKVGEVLTGTVAEMRPYGAFIDLDNGIIGLVHISQISAEHIRSVEDVFKAGDQVKVLVLNLNERKGRVILSTKTLEPTPGAMLRDPQAVYALAEETAAAFRQRLTEQAQGKGS